MTLDEFAEQLNSTTQRLQDLAPILTEIGNELTSELRADAPSTGRLQNSIQLEVGQTQFAISMLAYGVFQNYGVVGVDGGARATNPRDGQVIPDSNFPQGSGDGGKYQFGVKQPKYRGWGAYYSGFSKNVGWFDMDDITTEVTRRLQQKINDIT